MQDRLVEIFSMTLNIDPSQCNDQTSPENSPEWDSLANMILIAAIEETFEIELSTTEIESMKSIGGVRKVLETRNVVVG